MMMMMITLLVMDTKFAFRMLFWKQNCGLNNNFCFATWHTLWQCSISIVCHITVQYCILLYINTIFDIHCVAYDEMWIARFACKLKFSGKIKFHIHADVIIIIDVVIIVKYTNKVVQEMEIDRNEERNTFDIKSVFAYNINLFLYLVLDILCCVLQVHCYSSRKIEPKNDENKEKWKTQFGVVKVFSVLRFDFPFIFSDLCISFRMGICVNTNKQYKQFQFAQYSYVSVQTARNHDENYLPVHWDWVATIETACQMQ